MQDQHRGNSRTTSATVTTRGSTPRDSRGSPGGDYRNRDELTIATGKIVFAPLDADLFNGVARQVAETIAENRNANKPSQIRKFYDELCLWETKVNQDAEKTKRFTECLPFIFMLNAKAAYAKGRKLVDANFVKLIGDLLKQVKDPDTLRLCKLFFEAFLGFYKELRPSDK
ncbi:MAG: type III-A CRISPR-associated protein Csm2 [Candidatus Competibacteraceae bacterium]|nr:MAG: type III-A CRISPR-associated protein Csm2 [Candidatus Competibacteraceae bacterium]